MLQSAGPRVMTLSRLALLALTAATSCAFAQEQEIQRALIQRQQQSDSFNMQLRQSIERGRLAPGDLRGQQELDSLQLQQRQQLENLGAQQFQGASQPLSPDAETARQLQPYARQRAADERVLQFPPPVELRRRRNVPDAPLPLPGAARGGVDPVSPERPAH